MPATTLPEWMPMRMEKAFSCFFLSSIKALNGLRGYGFMDLFFGFFLAALMDEMRFALSAFRLLD
jgi:hypothetical protein